MIVTFSTVTELRQNNDSRPRADHGWIDFVKRKFGTFAGARINTRKNGQNFFYFAHVPCSLFSIFIFW